MVQNKIVGAEMMHMNFKHDREYKKNRLLFNEEKESLEITFNNTNNELVQSLLSLYGFYDSKEMYGTEYGIYFNNDRVTNKSEFKENKIKKGDVITIFYKNIDCFWGYSNTIVFEIDDDHDDDHYLRIELEK